MLATSDAAGHPYTSLVAFAAAADSSELYFITPNATRKYANLMHQPEVALLVNDCVIAPADFHQAMAVTILWRATALDSAQKKAALPLYLKRHPSLQQFAHSSASTMFAIAVSGYTMIQQFLYESDLTLD